MILKQKKYKEIEQELIRYNTDRLHAKSPINDFVKLNARMITQGLQLAEEKDSSEE